MDTLEIDTVYSGKEGSKNCLLTLTESKSRCQIVREIPDRTAGSVIAELGKLERQAGLSDFQAYFPLYHG